MKSGTSVRRRDQARLGASMAKAARNPHQVKYIESSRASMKQEGRSREAQELHALIMMGCRAKDRNEL